MLFNFAIHALWGDEYFLYSQHWFFSSLVLISGITLFKGMVNRVFFMILVLVLAGVIVNNGIRLSELFTFLD